jgi:hypothetical protein
MSVRHNVHQDVHPSITIAWELQVTSRLLSLTCTPLSSQGAHLNIGLGHSFLRHIERSRALVYIIDASGSDGRDPCEDLSDLLSELECYKAGMTNRVCFFPMQFFKMETNAIIFVFIGPRWLLVRSCPCVSHFFSEKSLTAGFSTRQQDRHARGRGKRSSAPGNVRYECAEELSFFSVASGCNCFEGVA